MEHNIVLYLHSAALNIEIVTSATLKTLQHPIVQYYNSTVLISATITIATTTATSATATSAIWKSWTLK